MYAYEGGAMVGSGETAAVPSSWSFHPALAAEHPALASSSYGARSGPNWIAILTILALHGAALAALVKMDVISLPKARPAPLVVTLLAEPPAPPPAEAPQPKPVPAARIQPVVIAPPPIVPVAAPAPVMIAVAPAPAPPRPVAVAAPAAPAGPVTVSDLSAKLIEGKPPRYPLESRRKREQGTVVLDIVLNIDGTVASLAVARSSGFDRLDKAALDAVRKWRWSPTMRGGQAVAVRGTFDFPFALQS